MSSSAEHDRTLSDNACACTGKSSKHFNESSQGNLDDIFCALHASKTQGPFKVDEGFKWVI